MTKRTTLLICGNYGAGNFGDELILMGLLKVIRQFPHIDIIVMTGNPAETSVNYGVKTCPFVPSSLLSWIKSLLTGKLFRLIPVLLRTDIILFGGGCLFNESEPASMRIWYAHYLVFKFFRKKLVIIGQSFGTFTQAENLTKIRNLTAYASRIFVRDSESKQFLESFHAQTRMSVLSDSAFWLEPSDVFTTPKHAAQFSDKNLLLIALRSWPLISEPGESEDKLHTKIVQVSKEAHENYGLKSQIIILQTGKNGDAETSQRLYKKIEQFCENPPQTWANPRNITNITQSLFPLYARSRLILSMRLHGAIAGVLHATPILAINYDPKVENLFREAGLEEILIRDLRTLPERAQSCLQSYSALHKLLSSKRHVFSSQQAEFKNFLTKQIKSLK